MWMHCGTVVASVEQNTFKCFAAGSSHAQRERSVGVLVYVYAVCVCLWLCSYQFNMSSPSPLLLLSCYYCRIDNLICHLIGVLKLVLYPAYFHTSSIQNWTQHIVARSKHGCRSVLVESAVLCYMQTVWVNCWVYWRCRHDKASLSKRNSRPIIWML